MMSLELAVSRAVLRARLAEHALHSDFGWTITVGESTVPANRTVLDDRIVFSAMFVEEPTGDVQVISHEGVPLSVRPFTAPGFWPFIIDWSVSVSEEPVAA